MMNELDGGKELNLKRGIETAKPQNRRTAKFKM